jgi:FAD/FMN-containing dehydrogenase
MICEFYTPGERLEEFMTRLGRVLRREGGDLIYGTVRFIERDDETFLAWARESFACVVVNLRVLQDEQGIEDAKRQFRAVTDEALALGGSYFLTYHRWATKEQVLRAYPQFIEFLRAKLRHDPRERFQSEWYRHYKVMFAAELRTE